MQERDNNTYIIPANYTDSGKWFGGLISARNMVESIVLVLGLGYLEYAFIPMTGTVRIIVMILTLLPLGTVALIGIDGDSLCQYLIRIGKYLFRRRKIHFSKAVIKNEQKKT